MGFRYLQTSGNLVTKPKLLACPTYTAYKQSEKAKCGRFYRKTALHKTYIYFFFSISLKSPPNEWKICT